MAEQVVYTKEQIEKASYPDIQGENLAVSKIPIKRLDFKGNRVYYQLEVKPEDREYIYSSTTIIGKVLAKGLPFDRWLGNSISYDHAMRYANERATLGSMCHALIMWLVWGKNVDCSHGFISEDSVSIVPIPDEIKLRLQGFIDFYHEYNPTPIATEISLYCDDKLDDGTLKFPFAGTADQIMTIDGKIWLIDIKTGKEYRDHELQLTSYKMLWDHIYGEELGKIDILACLYLNSKGKYKVKKYKFAELAWWNLYELFEYAMKDGRGKMPVISEKEKLPNIYSLKGEKTDER